MQPRQGRELSPSPAAPVSSGRRILDFMGLPWGTIAFGMVKNPLRGVQPLPESFPPVGETKILKIKTIRNIPHQSPTHPFICAVKIFLRLLQRNLIIVLNILPSRYVLVLSIKLINQNIMHILSIAFCFSSKEPQSPKQIYIKTHKSHE